MKIRFGVAIVVAVLSCGSFVHSASAATPRIVMTWMQSWALPQSLAAMKMVYSSAGPKKAITHIGIQGWLPTSAGGVVKDSSAASDAEIKDVIKFAHNHGIKVVLCVYNNTGGGNWDWALAKSAFGTNHTAFISALVAEMNRLKLDGIDIDLEGDNQFDGDAPAYVTFVKKLYAKLNPAGKSLTVDSFPYMWNAPNWTWWAQIFPHVDGVTSMGYQDMGMNGGPDAWQRYSNQAAQAGKHANKLMLGMDASYNTWQGNGPVDQTNWVVTNKVVGVSIWDAQFTGTAWQTKAVWKNLEKVRGN